MGRSEVIETTPMGPGFFIFFQTETDITPTQLPYPSSGSREAEGITHLEYGIPYFWNSYTELKLRSSTLVTHTTIKRLETAKSALALAISTALTTRINVYRAYSAVPTFKLTAQHQLHQSVVNSVLGSTSLGLKSAPQTHYSRSVHHAHSARWGMLLSTSSTSEQERPTTIVRLNIEPVRWWMHNAKGTFNLACNTVTAYAPTTLNSGINSVATPTVYGRGLSRGSALADYHRYTAPPLRLKTVPTSTIQAYNSINTIVRVAAAAGLTLTAQTKQQYTRGAAPVIQPQEDHLQLLILAANLILDEE